MGFKKLIEGTYPRHHKPLRAITINCSDPRIAGSRGLCCRTLGITTAAPITIPGGIKSIAEPQQAGERAQILSWIELLSGDHTDTIVATAHNTCKACDSRDDRNYYERLLRRAAMVLQNRFPRYTIFPAFIDFDGIYILDQKVPHLTLIRTNH